MLKVEGRELSDAKSTSLKYEPSSELLLITAKELGRLRSRRQMGIALSSLNPQPETRNPKPSTLNPQPSTLNPQHSTLNLQPSTLNPHSLELSRGAQPVARRCPAPRPHCPPRCCHSAGTPSVSLSLSAGTLSVSLSLSFCRHSVTLFDRETERQRDRGTEGQRDRGTEGQRDIETEGQRDRGTERHRHASSLLAALLSLCRQSLCLSVSVTLQALRHSLLGIDK